jgi:DNA-directed RNA polymerase specialized sigma subunit
MGANEPSHELAPERTRFHAAMQDACASAITALPARDRLRLSCYYLQRKPLAAIGKMLGEHEATVSRHLTRIRLAIRDAVDARLRQEHGLDDAAIAECFRTVVDDAGALNLADWLGASESRKKTAVDRSTG